ncbi:MFS transporter [Sinomonas flava]|uniref:MFS transporter n=1 Tax=Sinomonas flava TaxID=496857 RepID=UPI0039A544A5
MSTSQHAAPTPAAPERRGSSAPAGRRRAPWLLTLVLSLSGTLVALQQTLVVPLLPDFPKILGVSPEDASWLVTATLLTAAVATPIVSKLADMFGKKLMMLVCLGVMIAGSVVAAVGLGFAWVIVGRALQGFSASLIPVGISIMRDELPPKRVGGAVALMSATLGIGGALGLPLAGVIYDNLGWHSLFWVTGAAGVAMFAAILGSVPESRVKTPGRFDLPGALLLSAALVALLLAVTKGGSWGWGSPAVLGLFLAAGALLAVWFPYELRIGAPMVDLRTSARRPVLLTNIASVLVGFSMFANLLLASQQLQFPTATGYGFGLTVLEAGLVMVPSGLVMAVFAPVSGAMINRLGGRLTLIIGAAVLAVSYVFRVFFSGSVLEVAIGATLVSIGTAIAYAPMPTLIMGSVPVTETASANGLNALLRAVGTSASSAAVAAFLSTVVVRRGDATFPSADAFHDVYWMAAVAALGAIAVVWFVPKPTPTTVHAARDGGDVVVRGILRTGAGAPATRGLVTVLTLDGTPMDWARIDTEGRFSVAVPEAGQYLAVATAPGWAPSARVVRLEPETPHELLLGEEQALHGVVHDAAGAPVRGAVLSVVGWEGAFEGTARTDDDGRYRLLLPPAGRYVVSLLDPATEHAQARKVHIETRSQQLDWVTP